ncbi:hypothetical protein HY636_03400 [Candidatus Woesearchaeota archaeon]|nr:hypothetical protein [Candidatus Woesearchaeota archaeon]
MKRKKLDTIKDWLDNVDTYLEMKVNHFDAKFYARFPRTYRLLDLIVDIPLKVIECFSSIGSKKSTDGKAAQEKAQHQEQKEKEQVKQTSAVYAVSHSAISHSKYDLDTIIEREGMEGLSRTFNGLNVRYLPDLFNYLSEKDLKYAAERYTTAKINHALRLLGIDSLFESDTSMLAEETSKQKFARREAFIEILNQGYVLLRESVFYSDQYDKLLVTGEEDMSVIPRIISDMKIKIGIYKKPSTIRNKRILMHLLAFDYFLDIAAYEHYLGLLKRAGKIRKKRMINADEEQREDADAKDADAYAEDTEEGERLIIDGLRVEYGNVLSKFVNDRQIMLQKDVNLLNLVNSSLSGITKIYLDYLVSRYEFVNKEGMTGANKYEIARQLQRPDEILKTKEYNFIAQWEQEKNFKGMELDCAIRGITYTCLSASIPTAGRVVIDLVFHHKENITPYVALGLGGVATYLVAISVLGILKKLKDSLNRVSLDYLGRNEPLIERIIHKGNSGFNGYKL